MPIKTTEDNETIKPKKRFFVSLTHKYIQQQIRSRFCNNKKISAQNSCLGYFGEAYGIIDKIKTRTQKKQLYTVLHRGKPSTATQACQTI